MLIVNEKDNKSGSAAVFGELPNNQRISNPQPKRNEKDWTGDGSITPRCNKERFSDIASHYTSYFTSHEILKFAKDIFGGFADYVGAIIETNSNNEIFLRLRFAHPKKALNDPNKTLAFSDDVSDGVVKSDGTAAANMNEIIATANLLSRSMGKNVDTTNFNYEGTHYQITNEGKCIIHQFIDNRFPKDWSKACQDVRINNVTYTDINGIDVTRILEEKFGKTLDPTDPMSPRVNYLVETVASADMAMGRLYKLQVTQFIPSNVDDQLNMFGFGAGQSEFQ